MIKKKNRNFVIISSDETSEFFLMKLLIKSVILLWGIGTNFSKTLKISKMTIRIFTSHTHLPKYFSFCLPIFSSKKQKQKNKKTS